MRENLLIVNEYVLILKMYRIRGKYIALLTFAVMITALLFSPIYISQPVYDPVEEVRSLSEGPWPSFGRDKSNTRLSPYNTSHVDGTIDWNINAGPAVRSSPAIGSNGVLYFGSIDESIYAVDVDDGQELWRYETDGVIISSPAVSEDEIIYFGSGDNNIYALNPDGSLRWKYETGGEVYSSPTVDGDGNVYVGSYDSNLYSISKEGNLNWKFSSDSWLWSSPSISEDDVVYVGSGDGNIYAIDKTEGVELWNYSTEGYIYSSPAIGENGIYFGSYDGSLYALDEDGNLKWSFDSGVNIHSSPAVAEDETVYFGNKDGIFYAVRNGSELWSYKISDEIRSSPALSADGYIHVGSYDNNIYTLDKEGNFVWSHDTGAGVYSSPAIGEDGRIFVGSLNGLMYAFTGSENLPEIDIDIWREVEISVEISGRINNGLNAVLERDGEEIKSLELVRKPGKPQMENITIRYQEEKNYTISVEYESNHRGSNPVWVKFTSGNISKTIFENFNYNFEDEHEKTYDLNEEIGDMVSKVREVHFGVTGDFDENDIISCEWGFGDGNSSEGLYVVHEYSDPGVYDITVHVSFEDGQIISMEDIVVIDVYEIPEIKNRNSLRNVSMRRNKNRYLQFRPI